MHMLLFVYFCGIFTKIGKIQFCTDMNSYVLPAVLTAEDPSDK